MYSFGRVFWINRTGSGIPIFHIKVQSKGIFSYLKKFHELLFLYNNVCTTNLFRKYPKWFPIVDIDCVFFFFFRTVKRKSLTYGGIHSTSLPENLKLVRNVGNVLRYIVYFDLQMNIILIGNGNTSNVI